MKLLISNNFETVVLLLLTRDLLGGGGLNATTFSAEL